MTLGPPVGGPFFVMWRPRHRRTDRETAVWLRLAPVRRRGKTTARRGCSRSRRRLGRSARRWTIVSITS